MRARVKANVVPIRTSRQPAPAPTATQQIGTAGTEALYLEVPIRTLISRVTTGPIGEMVRGESLEEEATTMLLFARGAVIRLAASVVRGQDLLLINKRTNKYVHCRVKNLRTSPEAKSYVEIEFTHSAPDFWGIAFPKEALSTASAGFAAEPASESTVNPWLETPREGPPKALAAAMGATAAQAAAAVPAAAPERAMPILRNTPTPLADWDDLASTSPTFQPQPAAVALGQPAAGRAQGAPELIQFINLESLIIPEPRSKRVRMAWVAAGVLCALIAGYRLLSSEQPEMATASQTISSVATESGQEQGNATPLSTFKGPAEKSRSYASAAGMQTGEPSGGAEVVNDSTVTAVAPEVIPVESPRRLVVLVSKMNPPIHNIPLAPHEAPDLPADAGGEPSMASAQLNGKDPGGALGLLTATSPEPPPPAEPAAVPEKTVKPEESLVPARLVSSTQPVYPFLAKQAHIEGNVVIEVQIDAAGIVTGTKVISGPQALRQAAINAIAHWRFEPARLRDWPTASTTMVTLRFMLH